MRSLPHVLLGIRVGSRLPLRRRPIAPRWSLTPRVIMPLLATALGIVAASKTKSILVSASIDERQQTKLNLLPQSNGQSANIPCVPPPIIEPSLDVVHAAASLTGANLTVDQGEHKVCILIPPAQVSQTVVKPNAQPQG